MIVKGLYDACECCYVLLGAGEGCRHPECQAILLTLAPTEGSLHAAEGETSFVRTGCDLCGQGGGMQMIAYQVVHLVAG